jgi:hypothetical protein
MISVNNDWYSKKVGSPFFQGSNNCQEFHLVHRVVLFWTLKLHGVEGYGVGEFPRGANTKGSACLPVARITSDEYFIVTQIFVVYSH